LDGDLEFVWARTVELWREGVCLAVPTDFKAALEADSLENILGFWTMRRRGWLAVDRKAKDRLDPEWSA